VTADDARNSDGAPMSLTLRRLLIGYLLTLGMFLIYGVLRLNTLDFPDVALTVEAPQPSGVQAPPPPTGPPGTSRPALVDAFPHIRANPTPVYELALYGSGFVDKSQVRLNGAARAPSAPPREDLIRVVPTPGDLVGTGILVVEVLNPDGAVSNALALRVERPRSRLRLFTREWTVTREMQLLLMVLFAGALGSLVHAVKSLADFIGNRTAITSWTWWYVTRPFLGSALAFIVYAVLRGGFLTGTPADVRVVNPFGAMAVAALVGMFADKAAQKLAELFDTLFKADDKRGGKLGAPVIDKLEPRTVNTGTQAPVDLKIIGERLGAARAVKIGAREAKPDKVGDKEVVVRLQPADMEKSGAIPISVVTTDAASPSLNLFVSDLAIDTSSLPAAQRDVAYEAPLSASGGTGALRWTMEGTPTGLKIDPLTGVISGKPAKEGDAKVVVTVTDTVGASVARELILRVAA
jgi:hypothetical protein